ncbi:MAG: SsrA-binding protein SmpB [Bdellovibrionales bacterium]|nr:SsrA-binding protein SmpB [Bdellovibrionales bacterium]
MSIKIISENKKARYDYHIIETYEAGLVLSGSEVKSLRLNSCSLKDSYIYFMNEEAYILKMHISVLQASSYNNHEPERKRKLLMNRQELDNLSAKLRERGLACVPLKIYFKNGRAKLEIALVKGKQASDKRESIKQREANRQVQSRLRHMKK